MSRAAAAAALFLISAVGNPAASQPRKFDVQDDGEHVEVTVISTQPLSQPRPFFDRLPPQVLTSTLTLSDLADRYATEFRQPEQARLLEFIGKTKPVSDRDIRSLLNLYNRHPRRVRGAIQKSLRHLSERDAHFDPFFVMLLHQPDTSFQAFGMLGALQIRSEAALPTIQRLAGRSLDRPDYPDEVAITLQALRILAAWKAPGGLRALQKQTEEFPEVANLIALHYWQEAIADIIRWSESKKSAFNERARAAWKADVPVSDLRATRAKLKELVLNEKLQALTRHQASIKLGLASSKDDEAAELIRLREEAGDEKTKLYLLTAIFATRNQKAVPLLIEHAKTHPAAINRAGALAELKDLLNQEEYVELLRWMLKNDVDQENRTLAETELSLLSGQ